MQGKVVVITGGTSGIGLVASERLAAMGARLVLVARDRTRGEATMARLRAAGPNARHAIHYADLSLIRETKRVGAAIAAAETRIDVLINNAGAVFGRRILTDEGLERTFALNHMSYFVLSDVLRERLIASGAGRIVNTASNAHRRGNLDLTDLQWRRRYISYLVYGTSKLCNILFTRELARRLQGTDVTANCLHPGFVATRFGDEAGGLFTWGVRLAKLFAISQEKGAETIVYLASSPDVAATSGGYFFECRPAKPNAAARDDTVARQLWEESEAIAAAIN